jgi:S1-C subfamily serine protease
VGNLPEIDDKYIGGGFGFSLAALDGGSVIAAWVDEGSPAHEAGLRAGDELLTWNGEPVGSALEAVSPIFDGNAATRGEPAPEAGRVPRARAGRRGASSDLPKRRRRDDLRRADGL